MQRTGHLAKLRKQKPIQRPALAALLAFAFLATSLGTSPVTLAAKPDCAALPGESATIKSITPDNSLLLMNGDHITLANIKLAETLEAHFLKQWLTGRTVTLYPTGRLKDRHNRLIRQVLLQPRQGEQGAPLWLQKELVATGRARVYALPNTYACARVLLAEENIARLEQRGQWAKEGGFKIYQASDIATLNRLPQGSFIAVQGKLKAVGGSSRNTYLNFSDNWNTDFTALVHSRLLRRKSSRWPDLKSLVGKTVIVRGWLDHWRGPMIRLATPEMLTVAPETN